MLRPHTDNDEAKGELVKDSYAKIDKARDILR